MTQFKDKQQRFGADAASVGLFTYPILQVADILLYNPHGVPVGEDQRQHVELSRGLAKRFNSRYGETFTVPEVFVQKAAAKIYDLQNPAAKMSKSAASPAGLINLLDPDKVIAKRIKSAVNEAMRAVGDVNKYVTDTEPFKLKGEDQRERLATVLHTLIQCVSDLNTILAPFLPHASNRVHAFIGGEGEFMPMPVVEQVQGLDEGDKDRTYPIITGEYSTTPRWESRPVTVGAPIAKPTGVFVKLDEAVVDEELARLEQP